MLDMVQRFRPVAGPVMTEDTILKNLTHRLEFEKAGGFSRDEAQAIIEKYAPQDGRNVECWNYSDNRGIGHLVLAWKEKPVLVGAAKEEVDESGEDWTDR